jgi:hypothetical protein
MAINSLIKRLRALETQPPSGVMVRLHYADGSSRRIPGGLYLVDLLSAVARQADMTHDEQQHLDWVRTCVAATGPGGGRMIEILKCALYGPARDSQAKSELTN